jgi:hypothetical protein
MADSIKGISGQYQPNSMSAQDLAALKDFLLQQQQKLQEQNPAQSPIQDTSTLDQEPDSVTQGQQSNPYDDLLKTLKDNDKKIQQPQTSQIQPQPIQTQSGGGGFCVGGG